MEFALQKFMRRSVIDLLESWICKERNLCFYDVINEDNIHFLQDCAPTKDTLWVAKVPNRLQADSEYSDQTARMRRLI